MCCNVEIYKINNKVKEIKSIINSYIEDCKTCYTSDEIMDDIKNKLKIRPLIVSSTSVKITGMIYRTLVKEKETVEILYIEDDEDYGIIAFITADTLKQIYKNIFDRLIKELDIDNVEMKCEEYDCCSAAEILVNIKKLINKNKNEQLLLVIY